MQIFLLSIIKQTTSQNTYILYESLAGNQRNLLSEFFLPLMKLKEKFNFGKNAIKLLLWVCSLSLNRDIHQRFSVLKTHWHAFEQSSLSEAYAIYRCASLRLSENWTCRTLSFRLTARCKKALFPKFLLKIMWVISWLLTLHCWGFGPTLNAIIYISPISSFTVVAFIPRPYSVQQNNFRNLLVRSMREKVTFYACQKNVTWVTSIFLSCSIHLKFLKLLFCCTE